MSSAYFVFITVRNEVVKVMFLHLSVSHSVHGGGTWTGPQGTRYTPRTRSPLQQVHPQAGTPPAGTPRVGTPSLAGTPPTPSRRLLLRTVRILLECILVYVNKKEMSDTTLLVNFI